MPLICIGPVCIPVTALIPVLAYLARPVWTRLPPSTQQAVLRYWQAYCDWMQVNVWDKLGWKAKKQAPKAATPAPPAGAEGTGLREQLGSVVGIHSVEEWQAALAFTQETDFVMVVDFTAEWCGPCQKIKPFFAELAQKHASSALFVKVDVDEVEEISTEAGVMAMPTFQVYKKGELTDTTTGARTEALAGMVEKAAAC